MRLEESKLPLLGSYHAGNGIRELPVKAGRGLALRRGEGILLEGASDLAEVGSRRIGTTTDNEAIKREIYPSGSNQISLNKRTSCSVKRAKLTLSFSRTIKHESPFPSLIDSIDRLPIVSLLTSNPNPIQVI